MKYDKGQSIMKTWTGTTISFFLLLITYAYAYQKSVVWIDKKDMTIMESIQADYFDSE